ncbi:MAG: ATP-binding protein [Rivularia sp. ALOHA_DT_140]|nr:ATP-binding protein [Rivularia sp. ALOHA_DT_140]
MRVNQKLSEIVGYSSEEILNLTFQDITHPDDLETDLNYVRQLMEGEIEYYSMEKRYIRKDGSTIWVEITPKLLRNPSSNEPIYFIAVVEDIEERKQAQLQLQQKVTELAQTTAELSKRNQELDQFAYIASHDLKAPLRAIANLSQWLEDDLSDNLPQENQRQLELLRGRVVRMERLINSLLEYSRVGRIERQTETVDVGRLLDEVIDLLAPPQDFTIEIISPMPIFTAQKLPLTQIFHNLIGNAIKHHTRQNGSIIISVQDKGRFYEFLISDDGSGIAPEYHQKIFAIFQTLESRDKKENTGMGLAIVKKILEDNGGDIWIDSQLGKGSRFYFNWLK